MVLAWVIPAGFYNYHHSWEGRHSELHTIRKARAFRILPQPKSLQYERVRALCAPRWGAPHGDLSDNTAFEDTLCGRTLPREMFLRHAANALAGVMTIFALAQAASALDPQRDKNTALPPPPALLLPVQRIRVSLL